MTVYPDLCEHITTVAYIQYFKNKEKERFSEKEKDFFRHINYCRIAEFEINFRLNYGRINIVKFTDEWYLMVDTTFSRSYEQPKYYKIDSFEGVRQFMKKIM